MRTRCPVCSTIFRVTSEQLRLRAGKVRCGHCDSIFNAFEALLEDEPPAVPVVPEPPAAIPPAVRQAPVPPPVVAVTRPSEPVCPSFDEPPVQPVEPVQQIELPAEPEVPLALEIQTVDVPAPVVVPDEPEEVFEPEASSAPPELPPLVEPLNEPTAQSVEKIETTEESTLAAREAGLVAARELSDTPAYNRWAAGALAGNGMGGFSHETEHAATWPFVLVSIVLGIALSCQLLFHFRTDLVRRMPDLAGLYALAAVDVPLPQDSDLVAIESSDLQSDNARGLFVLQAALRNRAAHAQAWPALELTLTDVHDMVVSRRVLLAPDYLPPGISPVSFPANGELAIRLWVEAKDIGAAGYRLYVFYP